MTLRAPIALQDVFVDPDEIVDAVVARAPYWNQARYLPKSTAASATTPPGHPLARPDGSAPPVFRADWAHWDEVIDGVDEIVAHPAFLEAACHLFDGAEAIPHIVHVNLTAPGPAIDAGHIDVPAFRGVDRRQAPGWLLLAMARSGLFDRWWLDTATAVAWLYRGAGGEFVYWPDGPDRPSMRQENLWNTAMVGDNDRMFHRVESVGVGDSPDLELRADSQLVDAGAGALDLVDGETVHGRFPVGDVRISVSWKAAVFGDQAAADEYTRHYDDLDLEQVRVAFLDSLLSGGLDVDADCALDDPEFVEAVATAYPRSSPPA